MKMLTVREYRELSRIRKTADKSVLRDLSDNQKNALVFRAIDALYERQSVVALHEIYAMALKTGMGRLTPGGAWNATPICLLSLERNSRSRTHA